MTERFNTQQQGWETTDPDSTDGLVFPDYAAVGSQQTTSSGGERTGTGAIEWFAGAGPGSNLYFKQQDDLGLTQGDQEYIYHFNSDDPFTLSGWFIGGGAVTVTAKLDWYSDIYTLQSTTSGTATGFLSVHRNATVTASRPDAGVRMVVARFTRSATAPETYGDDFSLDGPAFVAPPTYVSGWGWGKVIDGGWQ